MLLFEVVLSKARNAIPSEMVQNGHYASVHQLCDTQTILFQVVLKEQVMFRSLQVMYRSIQSKPMLYWSLWIGINQNLTDTN